MALVGRGLAVVFLVAAVLSPAAHGAAAGGTVAARSGCASLRRGGGPGDAGYLTQADAGKRVCVRVGQQFAVYLWAPSAKGPDWAPIHRSTPAYLTLRLLETMVVAGETAANYLAHKPGTTRLSSTRRVCGPPPPGGVSCLAIEAWSATVVVLPARHGG